MVASLTERFGASLRSRRLVVVAAVCAGALVLALALVVRWYVAPGAGSAADVDAVVVLAGGQGERLDRTEALVATGDVDDATIVFITGNRRWGGWPDIEPLCTDGLEGVRVICAEPTTDDTKGDVEIAAAVARENGWESIAVVTSDYHMHRSLIRFDQCFGGRTEAVPADTATSVRLVGREILGTVEARVLDRSCDIEALEIETVDDPDSELNGITRAVPNG
ncbi:MAG: YdcF family protein [Actinomycetota bacterium]